MPQLDVFTLFAQSFFTLLTFWISTLYFRGFVLSEIFATVKLNQYISYFLLKFSKLFYLEITNFYSQFLNFLCFINLKKQFVLDIYKL